MFEGRASRLIVLVQEGRIMKQAGPINSKWDNDMVLGGY